MVQHGNLIKTSSSTKAQVTKLKLEKELHAAICKFLILSEIFICAPIGVHQSKIEQNVRCFRNLKALHIFWCLLIYAILVVCIYVQHTKTDINLPNIQRPLYACEYLIYLVHILQIIFASYYGRNRYHILLNYVTEYDYHLLEYDIVPAYSRYTRFCNVHLMLIGLHFVCTTIAWYFYSSGIFWSSVHSFIVYMLPNTILHVSLIQYYGLLHAIHIRFLDIKRILRASKFSSPFNILHDLRLFCLQLELFTKQVNDSFGPSIVLVYIGSYLNISVNILLLYECLEDFRTPDWVSMTYSIIWISMHTGKMFLILYYNHRIQIEKNNITLILNEQKSHSAEIEETIMHFVFQLTINTRSNIVCGVAELNLDFVKSLLVAISTLFIFLLQYGITSDALKKTHGSGGPKIF